MQNFCNNDQAASITDHVTAYAIFVEVNLIVSLFTGSGLKP